MRPAISCICVTGKDRFHLEHFLRATIECFVDQTYPVGLRELILVSERELPPESAGPGIRRVTAPDARTLGDLRNAGLDAAGGEFCLQWDDDDWHHPERIERQVAALSQTRAEGPDRVACFLKRQLCYGFGTDTAFVREFPNTFIHGTILHRNRAACRYPPLGREEDTYFLNHFPVPLVIDNAPQLYIRFAHGHNTWPEEHIMREAFSLRNQWLLSQADASLLRHVLAAKYAGVPRAHSSLNPPIVYE